MTPPNATSPDPIGDMVRRFHDAAAKMMRGDVKATMPFDPFAIATAAGEQALSLATRPEELMKVQFVAAQQWSNFWADTLSGMAGGGPPAE